MIFDVTMKYMEEFKFVIKAKSTEEAEKIALKLMDGNPASSDCYWYDSEICESKKHDEEEIDNQ
jgi:predicted 3-demethylubiquinone-9 3-methyltransferase (glyoxalase superfamily)